MAYNGTKLGQDSRFKNPDTKILSSMKTPKIYKTTVSKNNLTIIPIIKLWLNKKISEILEFEDETLANLIINLIKSSKEKIDPKNIQYQISGFLGDNIFSFMKQFWQLLINVQELYLKDKKSIPEELIPFEEEYEKRKEFYLNNKKKFERNQKDFSDINSNLNFNKEIINIEEKVKEDKKDKIYNNIDFKKIEPKDEYKMKDNKNNKYYKKSKSKSIDSLRYRSRERNISRSRSGSKNRIRDKKLIKNDRERYSSRSRSNEKRYRYYKNRSRSRSRSKSRNRRYRYKSRSRSITKSRNRKYERGDKSYKEDYKYRRSREKRREYNDEIDSCYTKSYDSKKDRKKKVEDEYRKSLNENSDSSSETLKIEPDQKSLFSDSKSSEEDFGNIKSTKYNYKIK